MRLRDLKEKEIINICTCRSLGCAMDLEFDPRTGKICAVVVPGPGPRPFCLFGSARESEYVIPWNCIKQIGDDIVLVEVQEEKCFHKEPP